MKAIMMEKNNPKMTRERAETELAELKEALKLIDVRIRENNGQKSRFWSMCMRSRIYKLEEKIEDLKANKVRTDELTPEDMKIEKRIKGLEDFLIKTIEGKK